MTEEDEAFEQVEKAQGWRKRQTEMKDECIDFKEAMSGEKFEAWRQEKIKEVSEERVGLKDAFQRESRNSVLEEVAREIEKMKAFGPDTIASFAVYVRNMKDAKTKTS
jgi:hypothetical protein